MVTTINIYLQRDVLREIKFFSFFHFYNNPNLFFFENCKFGPIKRSYITMFPLLWKKKEKLGKDCETRVLLFWQSFCSSSTYCRRHFPIFSVTFTPHFQRQSLKTKLSSWAKNMQNAWLESLCELLLASETLACQLEPVCSVERRHFA